MLGDFYVPYKCGYPWHANIIIIAIQNNDVSKNYTILIYIVTKDTTVPHREYSTTVFNSRSFPTLNRGSI